VEIAVATSTAPAQWRGEDDWTLATVLDVLHKQAASIRRK
jgi:hypothetical protein